MPERLADVLDRLPAGIGVFRGPDLSLQYANDALRELMPDESWRGQLDCMRTAMTTGEPAYAEQVAMPGGGFLDMAFLPLEDGVLVHATDVSATVRARDVADASDLRFEALVGSHSIGVTVTDEERLIEANEAFLDMVGLTPEDIERGVRWTDISAPEWAGEDERTMRLLQESGIAPPYEKEYVRPDGRRVPAMLSGTRIGTDPLRVLAVVYDLTERRVAEREIRTLLERERHARRTAERAHARMGRLQAVTASLSAALAPDEIARVLVHNALEDLTASAGSLTRVDGTELTLAYALGYDPELVEQWRRFPLSTPAPITDAVRMRKPVVVADTAAWARDYPSMPAPAGHGAAVAVPLVSGGRVLGALALSFSGARVLTAEDLEFLTALGQQGAIALERGQLFENRAYVARTLQEGLLPAHLDDVPGAEVAVRYTSITGRGEVGGDFYDLFAAAPGRHVLAVGDVCGKGTEAAVTTGLARHTIRALAAVRERPADVLSFLNEALRRDSEVPSFCTVGCAVVRASAGGLAATLASGGHPYPFILRAGGRLERVEVGGTMLGASPDPSLDEVDVLLGPGDALVMYTDGVTDARQPGGERFGEERLEQVLLASSGLTADAMAEAVEAAVAAHDPEVPADDRAIVVLRVRP
jgi:PAS domain S-box-containing protein